MLSGWVGLKISCLVRHLTFSTFLVVYLDLTHYLASTKRTGPQ